MAYFIVKVVEIRFRRMRVVIVLVVASCGPTFLVALGLVRARTVEPGVLRIGVGYYDRYTTRSMKEVGVVRVDILRDGELTELNGERSQSL